MDRESWAVLVRSRAEAGRVLLAAERHNDWDEADAAEGVKAGEQLACQGLLEFGGQAFLLLANGGGRAATSTWLHSHLPELLILWPGEERPVGWDEDSTFMWRPPSPAGALPEVVPLQALPLPRAPGTPAAEGLTPAGSMPLPDEPAGREEKEEAEEGRALVEEAALPPCPAGYGGQWMPGVGVVFEA